MKELIINDFKGFGEMIEIPTTKLYKKDNPLCVCKNTGLVRAKNIRSSKEIATAWSDEVYGSTFDEKNYTALIPAVKARQTYVADFTHINLNLKDKNICDIGAGEGQFFEIVSEKKYMANCFGIEPSKNNCDQLSNKSFDCFNGTAEEYAQSDNFSKKKVDIITIMWTLVNVASCIDIVKAAYQMLKPGGHIVVAEGSRILVPFKKPLNYYLSPLSTDLHPYHYSANSMSNLLKVAGFKITHINRYIDSDYLCLIAKKIDNFDNNNFKIDNYEDVLSFFERWHIETEKYYKE